MHRISILAGVLLLVGCVASQGYYKRRVTFAFVVDTTGSMSREIRFVRQAIKNATDHLSHFKYLGIDHFILVTFSDPLSANRIYEFSTLNGLLNGMNVMKASGGGDCPEYGFDGLLKAIKRSFDFSYIFYFSDASAKDSYKESEVIKAAKAKNITIYIIGTGCCSCSTYSPYGRVAKATGGVYYSTVENNVPYIMKYVNINVRCRHMKNLKHPPTSFSGIMSFLHTHKGCPEPTAWPTSWPVDPSHIPPVGGVAASSASLFTVMMTTAAFFLSF